MSASPLILATESEIRAIYQRACVAIDAVFEKGREYTREQQERDDAQVEAAVEALRFCAVAAGHLGEASLLPLVTHALRVCERFEDGAEPHRDVFGAAVTRLLQRGATLDEGDRALVEHGDARVRAALARGLLPRGDAELAMLEALAIDPIVEVRKAASETLSAVRDIPWWAGKFNRDPLSRLSEDEARRCKPTLEQLSALLDLSLYHLVQREPELLALVTALPDALLVEVAEKVLSTTDRYHVRLPTIGAAMLAREGGVDAFARLCGAWSDDQHFIRGEETAPMLGVLSPDARLAACLHLAALAVTFPEKDRAFQSASGARLMAETAAKAFPPGADLTPILDLALGLPPMEEKHASDAVKGALADAFVADGASPTSILDRALTARLAGYPGPWERLGSNLDKLLERASAAALRPFVDRALACEDDDTVTWALLQLVGPAHDPASDPPLPAVMAGLYTDLRYRARLLADDGLLERAAPLLRADLHAGELDFAAAVKTMNLLGELYGHGGDLGFIAVVRGSFTTPDKVAAARRKKLAELDAFLGPEARRGSPTEEEWSMFRTLRAAQPAEGKHALDLFGALPPGPWAAEDRALLDQTIERMMVDEPLSLARLAMVTLAAKPTLDTFPLFEKLLAGEPTRAHPLIRYTQEEAANALGLRLTKREEQPETVAAEPEEEPEWMDEPDA